MTTSQFRSYLFPAGLKEALSLLKSKGEKAKVIGGGTTFFELAQRDLFSDADCIIDLKNLELSFVKQLPSGFVIGASTTMSELAESEVLRLPYFGALLDAIRSVEPIQVRNVATIGGTVCASIPFFDVPVALCTLEASARIASLVGERTIPIEDVFVDNLVSCLSMDELLIEIVVPKVESVSCFLKHGRSGFDIGTVSCGVRLGVDQKGKITAPRVFLGNVSSIPYHVYEVEKILNGKSIEACLDVDIRGALEAFEPISSLQGSKEYKRDVSKVLLSRALTICNKRAGSIFS